MTTATITINGMSCGGCVSGVRGALERIGIKEAVVEIGSARVTWDQSLLTHEEIVEAIRDAGFEVSEGEKR